jgi:hypothetical protein
MLTVASTERPGAGGVIELADEFGIVKTLTGHGQEPTGRK